MSGMRRSTTNKLPHKRYNIPMPMLYTYAQERVNYYTTTRERERERERDARRFSARHDVILTEISYILSANTTPSTKISVDVGSYAFPQHIAVTDLHPDIICWDDSMKKPLLIEVTICLETSLNHAAEW